MVPDETHTPLPDSAPQLAPDATDSTATAVPEPVPAHQEPALDVPTHLAVQADEGGTAVGDVTMHDAPNMSDEPVAHPETPLSQGEPAPVIAPESAVESTSWPSMEPAMAFWSDPPLAVAMEASPDTASEPASELATAPASAPASEAEEESSDAPSLPDVPGTSVVPPAPMPVVPGEGVLGLKFREHGQLYFFQAAGVPAQAGDHVLVETEQGLSMGLVSLVVAGREQIPADYAKDLAGQELKPVLKLAEPADLDRHAENLERGRDAWHVCRRLVREHDLDMKLVDVEVLHDQSKILFYFTAPNRIDFRELVKDLVKEFHTRIELRQIGVRHETQMIGAIGNCGLVCCCRQFLRKFAPVTIKMAKEQNLFLNPTKISGMCGRLLCCLSFEQENYEHFHKQCPKIGKKYLTTMGAVKVLRANFFRNSLSVYVEGDEEKEITLEDWEAMDPRRPDPNQQQPQPQDQQAKGRGERQGRGDRGERADKSARPDRSSAPDKSDRPDRPDRPERTDRPDRPDRPDRSERSDRSDRGDRPPRQERPRPDKPRKERAREERRQEQAAAAAASQVAPAAGPKVFLDAPAPGGEHAGGQAPQAPQGQAAKPAQPVPSPGEHEAMAAAAGQSDRDQPGGHDGSAAPLGPDGQPRKSSRNRRRKRKPRNKRGGGDSSSTPQA